MKSAQDFLDDYANAYQNAMRGVDIKAIESAIGAIATAAISNRKILVIGNGGSAAIANHLCCDWTKGTNCRGHPTIRTHSLSSNVALYSAIANDIGFENVFSTQVEFFADEADVLIAISSSGNSENILRAVNAARARKMTVIGLSGFSGGQLARTSDISIHVNAQNYGIVEDCHQSIMHIISQFIALQRESPSNDQE